MKLKNLDDLAVFLKVIEYKSFSAAAREMNLAPTTVSKQIARLEAAFNCTLFERNTRHLKITDEGLAIADRSRHALMLLKEAEEIATQGNQEISGTIKLTASVPFGSSYVAATIAKFCQQHPQIDIELQLTEQLVDLYTADIDLAIRVGHLTDSRLIARRVSTNYRILVASPDYLKRFDTLQHPDQLLQHNCLLFSYPGVIHNVWNLHKEKQIKNITVSGNLHTNNGDVLNTWCLAGLGIALREIWVVADDLKAGRLVQVLPDWQEPPTPISIVRTKRAPVPRRISTLIEFIHQEWQTLPW